MNNLYFECCNIKILLVGTNDCIYKIQFVEEIKQSDSNLYLEKVKEMICAYLNGESYNLDFNYFYDTTIFKTEVYEALRETNIGEFLSYKELGERIDSKAYQAIGSAMRTNNLPLVIPCHRVIKNDRSLGNFTGGDATKFHLYYLESRYAFEKNCLKKVVFSDEDMLFILNHPKLNKMFKYKPVKQSYYAYQDLFSCLISQVIYQLISYATAYKMELRLYAHFKYHITPLDILNLSKKEASIINLPLNKLKYMQNIAKFYLDNNTFFEQISEYSIEEITAKLKTVNGIGRWTIEMFLIFGLANKNVFSFDDLILLNGYKNIYNEERISSNEKKAFLQEIKGFETLVAINLWEYIEKGYHLKNN